MNAVLPFEGFLDLLRAKGYAVSLREHFTLASLLQRWDGTSRAEFRDALAALIGRNEDEVQGIRRLFVELYGDPDALPIATTTAAIPALVPRQGRAWIAWTAAAVVLVGVLGFSAWRFNRVSPPAPSPTAAPPVADAPPPAPAVTESGNFVLPPPPPPVLPEPPSHLNRPVAAVATGAVFLVALAGFWGLSTRRASRRFLRNVWSTTISELPGPHRFNLVVRNRSIGFGREALEDAATILGRAFAWETPTRELDAARSIRQTLREGLLARLVFRPRRLSEPVLVFQDIGQDMSVWRTKVQSLLTNLARQGIAIERYYFDGVLRRVTDRPHRSPMAVERVMRRRANSPVLVISTGTGLAGAFEQGADVWLNELRARSRRSWLTPVVDLRLWPRELTRLSIPVWPMTARGLTQAAKDLAGIDGESAAVLMPHLEAEGYVTLDGIERMKRLASLVPHPTVDLLEALRVRFAPDVPDAAVLHLFADEGTQPAQVIRLSEAELRRCLDAVRNETPRLEAQVRTVVVEALKDSEPPAGSAAHLRWQAAIALHELVLADLRGEDTAAPLAVLRKLGQGPAWEEVRKAASLVPRTPALTAQLDAVLRSDADMADMIAKSTPVGIPGERAPMRWARPGLRDVVPATAIAVALFVIGWQVRLFPSTTIPHVAEVLRLTYVPAGQGTSARLVLRVEDAAPSASLQELAAGSPSIEVYQDDRLFRTGAPIATDPQRGEPSIPLFTNDTGKYYQARVRLPKGNLGLSNAVWVPSDSLVQVLIDAAPWATVTISGANSAIRDQVTPFFVSLAPGSYKLHFENSGLKLSMDRDITVTPTTNVFRFPMTGFDASAAAKGKGK